MVIDTNLKARYTSNNMDPRVTLMLRRSIKVLDEALKEIANKKMLTSVKVMINVCVDKCSLVDYAYSLLGG